MSEAKDRADLEAENTQSDGFPSESFDEPPSPGDSPIQSELLLTGAQELQPDEVTTGASTVQVGGLPDILSQVDSEHPEKSGGSFPELLIDLLKDRVPDPDSGAERIRQQFVRLVGSAVSAPEGVRNSVVEAVAGLRSSTVDRAIDGLRNNKWRFFGGVSVSAILAWFVAEPIAQPFLVESLRYAPAAAFGTGALCFAVVTAIKAREHGRSKFAIIRDWTGIGALCLLSAWLVFANVSPWFVSYQMSQALSPRQLQELPLSSNLRMLPLETAKQYAANANRFRYLGLESDRPVLVEKTGSDAASGKLIWEAALRFEGGVANLPWRLLGTIDQVVQIDATREGNHILSDGTNANFLFGGKSWLANLIFRWSHPFSKPGELVYYQKADGHWAMLISYISYRPTVAGTMVPELTGVMEFNRFGFFSNHSVSNAVKKFPGAVLFPPELGRQYAQAFAHWHEGLFSVVFDEYIDELSEQVKLVARNHMPYVQSYQDIGLVEVAAIEPSGEGKYALRGLLFFDAGSGKPHFWTPAQVDGYIGPRRAEDNVVAGEPEINWRNYHLVEPRVLVSSDRDLYYLFTMVQDDGSNHAVAKFFLENASTLKTYPFSTAQEVRDFLDGKQQAGL